jgi:hypothetical protein
VAIYDATGLLPWSIFNRVESIVTPQCNSDNQTISMVESFLAQDDTNNIKYKYGFNCIDSVLRIWRNAMWNGLCAAPVFLVYDKPPDHAIVAFTTTDEGIIFIEAQNDKRVLPRVGSKYMDKTVRGIYYMNITLIPVTADSPPADKLMNPVRDISIND